MSKVKEYKENSFAIDLIKDAYKTENPIIIADKIKETLDLDINISEIIKYLNNDITQTNLPWSMNSNEIFIND